MAFSVTGGAGLNATPSPSKQALAGNYLDFTTQNTDSADKNWAQQYLPDLMEKEAEVFGNRTVSGFLEKVGAEEAMASDQVVWSEQGRLHLSYIVTAAAGTDGLFTTVSDIDGNGGTDSGIRVGDMIVLSDADLTLKAYVTATYNEQASGGTLAAGAFTAVAYNAANFNGLSHGAGDCRAFVFGSEYAKGSTGRQSVNTPAFKSFANQPIILKDKYEVSGSDASQVGWVEVTGEEGQSGYLWYLKAAGDTKARFTDYCEMSMIESVKKGAATMVSGNVKGTEGLFAAIEDRGNVATQIATMGDMDDILKEFDKQGAIEENMMFVDRAQAILLDDMLAGQNGGNGGAGSAYGVFDNDQDMALNLGFSGFRRGSYDFYKTDWKYLNDMSTRGAINDVVAGGNTAGASLGDVYGCIIPAGVSTVYDQQLGKNLKRPFLHVRYRASALESRKFKTWTTGSVGAVSSDLDAMEMHFLSERCLVVQGANNFVMLKGASA